MNEIVWSESAIADAIMNNVLDGLHGSPNTPIPKEQLRQEIKLLRNTLVTAGFSPDGSPCAKGFQMTPASQSVGCLDILEGDPSDCCEGSGFEIDEEGSLVKYVRIPEMLRIGSMPLYSFFGDSRRTRYSWKIYFGESHRARVLLPSAARPYAVLGSAEQGYHKAYLYNIPEYLKSIALTAVFRDPYAIYEYKCCQVANGIVEDIVALAAPDQLILQIIETITQRYLTYYRQMNAPIQASDMADKIS